MSHLGQLVTFKRLQVHEVKVAQVGDATSAALVGGVRPLGPSLMIVAPQEPNRDHVCFRLQLLQLKLHAIGLRNTAYEEFSNSPWEDFSDATGVEAAPRLEPSVSMANLAQTR